MKAALHLTIGVIFSINCLGFEEKHFPEFRVLLLTLEGAWEEAPTVVVGDIKNVKAVDDRLGGGDGLDELPGSIGCKRGAGPPVRR